MASVWPWDVRGGGTPPRHRRPRTSASSAARACVAAPAASSSAALPRFHCRSAFPLPPPPQSFNFLSFNFFFAGEGGLVARPLLLSDVGSLAMWDHFVGFIITVHNLQHSYHTHSLHSVSYSHGSWVCFVLWLYVCVRTHALACMLSISVRISTIPGKILHHSLQPLFSKASRQKIACIMYAQFALDQHMCTNARTRSCTGAGAGVGARKHKNYLDCCRGQAFRCVSDFPVQVEVIGSYVCVCVRVSVRSLAYA
jgi:hypothetical protein